MTLPYGNLHHVLCLQISFV